MRTARLLAVLLALAAAGCFNDWDPERHDVRITATAGEEIEDHLRTDQSYTEISFDEDVDGLPPGVSYETESFRVLDDDPFDDEEHGRIRVEYEIRVAPWVPPGDYVFRVTYEIHEGCADCDLFESLFDWDEEKLVLTFHLRVEPPPEDGEELLRVAFVIRGHSPPGAEVAIRLR